MKYPSSSCTLLLLSLTVHIRRAYILQRNILDLMSQFFKRWVYALLIQGVTQDEHVGH